MNRFYRATSSGKRRKWNSGPGPRSITPRSSARITAKNVGFACTVTMQSDNHGALGIGNAAPHKFKQNGFAHPSVPHVRKGSPGQNRLTRRFMTSHLEDD